MKKIIISIILILLIAAVLIAGFFIRKSLTGNAIDNQENYYTYTKALCNDSNYCQDNKIECNGKDVIKITPLTGAVIQHSEDWQDPRNETELCL